MIKIVIFLVSVASCQYTDQTKDLCITPGCIHAASDIIRSLDESVDPCDDFYQFACGNAIEKINIPEDKQHVNVFSLISDKVQRQLRDVLQTTKQDDSRSIVLAKKYYQACMNEERIEQLGQKVFTDLLRDLGGWPILDGDSWNEGNFSWTSLMYKFRQLGLGIGYFIGFSITTDTKNSSIRTIELDQPPEFGLLREFLIEGKYIDAYHELMVDLAVQLGADRERAKKELMDAMEFEIALANLSLPLEERRNYTLLHNPMQISQLEQNYPGIPWLEYLNRMLPQEVQLNANYTVVVVVPKYLKLATELFSKTPARTQANYALWRVLQDSLPYSPTSIYKHFSKALLTITGQAERPKRWKECVDKVSDDLLYLVASMYVRKYFDEDAKGKVTELTQFIRKAFEVTLKDLDWMDEVTRKKALSKADKVGEHIAYPDELLDDKVLDEYYKKLEIDENQYLQSYLNIFKHDTDSVYKRLFEPINKTEWKRHAESYKVGAYYIPSENSIQLAAGILQGTFFNKHRPMYLNFGAIGSVIGHELTHGFDDEGRQLDEGGNLNNWWGSSTEKNFLNKTHCIINQYGSYTVKEINETINGIITQGENIADNGGIKQAYLAYNTWIEANGIEPKLPALNYTPHQLFWISAARNWCAKYRPQYLETAVKSDAHSPSRFRVMGPFSNSKEFSIDFNCANDSGMNPVQKCSVW